MATKILISYNFHKSQNVILLLILIQPFDNVKAILSSQDIQKQAVGQIGPLGQALVKILKY